MKVRDIIYICNGLLDLGLPERYFTQEGEAEQDALANKLVMCCNLVFDELYSDYLLDVRKTEVWAENGFVSLKDLPIRHLISLTDGLNRNVHYRYSDGGLITAADGKLYVSYSVAPPNVGFYGEVEISDVRISPRIVAYGVASEYCNAVGDFDSAEEWNKRYRIGLRSAEVKRSEMRMPARRWLY